jgi:single-strand DNA-binding protein
MNKAFLIGRLARDPELRTTPSGVAVCTFRLAISRRFANQQGVREADFINVVVWRAQGENCARYLTKGSQCAVVGSIQTRSYDAQDGTKRYVTEVVADEVEFLARAQGGSAMPGDEFAPPPQAPSQAYTGDTGFTQVDDDELPF